MRERVCLPVTGGKADAMNQVGKSGIGAHALKFRPAFEIKEGLRFIFVTFFEPRQGPILLAESKIDRIKSDVSEAPAFFCFLQNSQQLSRFVLPAPSGISVGEIHLI